MAMWSGHWFRSITFEACKAVPITDGQWFLYRKANCQQVWVCIRNSPFCVGMKTGPMPQDILIIKVVVPGHKDFPPSKSSSYGQVLARRRHFQPRHVN
eukprot:9066016-Karenia_brevis.AAC.1